MPFGRALAFEDSAEPRPVRAPTEVCITIDTEFSIGGAFADPERYRPIGPELVECAIDGRAEELGFIVDTVIGSFSLRYWSGDQYVRWNDGLN
jgi:hypothetical protein